VTNVTADSLQFSHARATLIGAGLLAALLVARNWLDGRRAEHDVQHWRAQLCDATLPARLVAGLGALSRETQRTPSSAREALAILQGMLPNAEQPGARARILFESSSGWRELRPDSDELAFSHDPALLRALRDFECQVSLDGERLRAVRPLQTASGLVALLVLERLRDLRPDLPVAGSASMRHNDTDAHDAQHRR
jgi:hypothetical protein